MFSVFCFVQFVVVKIMRNIYIIRNVMGFLKVVVIGQLQFGLEVYKSLCLKGYEIVGVFIVFDVKGKLDILVIGVE